MKIHPRKLNKIANTASSQSNMLKIASGNLISASDVQKSSKRALES